MIDGVDYGPLTLLIGKWIGVRGVDLAPEQDGGIERSKFIDELTFVPAGPATNAEEQELVSVRYHHLVRREENGLIFHDQIGHWIYEPSSGLIMHSLTIPRAVTLLAGGEIELGQAGWKAKVEAKSGSDDFGISQSPFMNQKAKTTAFEMSLSVTEDTLNYQQTTYLEIYGASFDHKDSSLLRKLTYDLD